MTAAHFCPVAWARDFEAAGGVLALNPDATLWLGVIGGEGAVLAATARADLARHPEWVEPLTTLVRQRLRR